MLTPKEHLKRINHLVKKNDTVVHLGDVGNPKYIHWMDGKRKILILGNGGLKSTATYEEDEILHKEVRTLQKIDIQLKQRENEKVIVVSGTELLGELSFTINDE